MPIANEIFKAWFIFSFTLGFWTCVNLFFTRSGNKHIKWTLIVFVGFLSVPSAIACVGMINQSMIKPLIMLSKVISWSYGPLLYCLVSHVLLKKPSVLSITLQALPFVIALMLQISGTQLGVLLMAWFFHIFGYLFYSAYVLIKNKQTLKRAGKHQNTTYYWLLYLIAGLLIVIFLEIFLVNLMINNSLPAPLLLGLIGSAMGVYISSIALFALYQPTIFYQKQKGVSDNEIISKKTDRYMELTPDIALHLNTELDNLVKEKRLHLDDTLSLPKLSSLLNISSNQLSELLNVHKQIGFYDYLNQLRFNES